MNNLTKKPRIILTFLAQQYGLTVEDLMRRNNCDREQIIVEEAPNDKAHPMTAAPKPSASPVMPNAAVIAGAAPCSAKRLQFFRPHELQVVKKYHVETLRHAANAIFNKLNEAGFCAGTEQGRQAIMDAQALADVIVQSDNAELPIGSNSTLGLSPNGDISQAGADGSK